MVNLNFQLDGSMISRFPVSTSTFGNDPAKRTIPNSDTSLANFGDMPVNTSFQPKKNLNTFTWNINPEEKNNGGH